MTWKVGKEQRKGWFVDGQSINHSKPIGFFDSPWIPEVWFSNTSYSKTSGFINKRLVISNILYHRE